MKFVSLIWFVLFVGWPGCSCTPLDRQTDCHCDLLTQGNLPENRPTSGRIVGEKRRMVTPNELASVAAIILKFTIDCDGRYLCNAQMDRPY